MHRDLALIEEHYAVHEDTWSCITEAWDRIKTAQTKAQPRADNSDYAAALQVLKKYYGDVDLKKVGGFAEYCVRLNASTHKR